MENKMTNIEDGMKILDFCEEQSWTPEHAQDIIKMLFAILMHMKILEDAERKSLGLSFNTNMGKINITVSLEEE